MTSEEKNLVDRFRGGDEAAFDDLYRLMYERIYRFSLRLTGHAQDAEDIALDTFVEAYRSLHKFKGASRLETWLYRIAVHNSSRQRSKAKRLPPLDVEFLDPTATDHVEVTELQDMLLALPEHLRAAFLLVKVEGLTHREAAEVLGRRLGTVQYHVFEAVKLLRIQFQAVLPPVSCEQVERCTT